MYCKTCETDKLASKFPPERRVCKECLSKKRRAKYADDRQKELSINLKWRLANNGASQPTRSDWSKWTDNFKKEEEK